MRCKAADASADPLPCALDINHELIACVPINEHVHFHHNTLTRLLDNPAAYEVGVLAVYPVALTDDPNDTPPGFNPVYTGIGLPDGHVAAWTPS
jgi:hypothetical protein